MLMLPKVSFSVHLSSYCAFTLQVLSTVMMTSTINKYLSTYMVDVGVTALNKIDTVPAIMELRAQ